jgi:hypothetical protein
LPPAKKNKDIFMKKRLGFIDGLAIIIVIIGALNWGFIGLFNYDVIATVLGEMNILTRVAYMIIGLAGLWTIFAFMKKRRAAQKT